MFLCSIFATFAFVIYGDVRMNKLDQLKHIYESYGGRMLSLCIRYCGRRDIAQDIMHDGFIQAYNSLDKFTDRGEGSLRAWTERIMINTCLQYLRKKDLMRESMVMDDNLKILSDDDLEKSVSRVPESVLMKFISELPVGYRTVFNLFVFEDMSHKQIAEILGINEKSSSSQLYRAKCTLAQKIKEYEQR